jgi:Fe-S cluster assembly iron-binding protein IscA
MALDEPKDTDTIYEIDGFQYIIDTEFLEKIKPIKVDFGRFGFVLSTGVDITGGAEACSSCQTTRSCCS